MDNMKRFVSFLLCFVMLLGFLPVNAHAVDATETPLDALVVFSDLHIGTNNTKESDKATLLKDVLKQIKTNVGTVSSVNSAGDMFSSNEGTVTSNTDNLNVYIREVFPNVPVNYTWTDHDRAATAISKKSGLVEYDNYYVYTLSMADLSSWDRYSAGFYSEAEIDQHIADFKTTVNGLNKNKPLFIVGHQPLFNNRGDNGYAYKWATAINEVAEGRDVTYFFGHNHNYDNISSTPNEYYYPEGYTIKAPTTKVLSGSGYSTKLETKDVTLKFNHICAGYMDPATKNNNTTRLGTALAIAIYGDRITYTAYDKDGVYDTNAQMALNVTVERKNKVSSIAPIQDSFGNTGITVAAAGVSVVEAAVKEPPRYDTSVYTAYASYDIAVGGDYMDGTEATVTIPTPDGFDLSKPAVVLDRGVQIAVDANIRDGITFTTTHFSTYDVAQTAVVQNVEPLGSYQEVTVTPTYDVSTYNLGWITFKEYVEAVAGKKQNKYVLDSDGINTRVDYLIVNTGTAGTGYALTNDSGTAARTEVTISNNEILMDTDKTANIVWRFSGTSSGTVSNSGRYLNPENGSLALNASDTTLTFTNQKAGAYRLYRTESYRLIYTRYFYVRYNNGWTGGSTTNGILSGVPSTMPTVHLYKEAGTVDTPAVPAVDGLYGKLTDDSVLTVEVANGTSKEAAIAAVQEAVNVEYKLSPNGDVKPCADSDVEWTLDRNYNGVVAGDYAVTISYQGKTLGIAEVVVASAPTYYGAEGLREITVDMGTTAGMAMTAVKKAVTIYSATDAQGSNATEIPDSSVTWEWVDDYNANRRGPYTVRIKAGDKSLGTVEVHVNVSYGEDEGESNSVTVGTSTTVTKKAYVLTNTIVSGTSYLIVNSATDGDAKALANKSNTIAATDVTIKTDNNGKKYIELTTATNELWKVNGTNSYTFQNQSRYLYRASSGDGNPPRADSSSTSWSYNTSNHYLSYVRNNTTYYLNYNNGWKANSGSSNADAIYFYTLTDITVTEGTGATYTMSAEGLDQYLTKDSMTAKLTYALMANGSVADPLPGGAGYHFEEKNDRNNIIESIDVDGTIHFTGATGTAQVRVSYTLEDGRQVYKYVTVNTTAPNNYPEYPNEGAVKVNKTGTGIDFQKTGIAQVEISASGVPMKRGVDIILMMDMSSSMERHIGCGHKGTSSDRCTGANHCDGKTTRFDELKTALRSLESILKTSNNSDMMRIAIADFNGFYSSGPCARDTTDTMSSYIQNASNTGSVYNPANGNTITITGQTIDNSNINNIFVPVTQMNVESIISNSAFDPSTGTNYDHAFDMIYQMGHAIKKANGEDSDRELVVIFMSDGAPNQYNYYNSIGGSEEDDPAYDDTYMWNKWLQGVFTEADLTKNNIGCATHKHYYDLEDHDKDGIINEHRMATAIKGDPEKMYPVIRKSNAGLTDIMPQTSSNNLYNVPGLGATMYAVAFYLKNDGKITEHSVHHVLEQVPSSLDQYVIAQAPGALENAFRTIATDVLYSAYNARFVDQMGKDYDLQMKPLTNLHGELLPDQDAHSTIEVIEYDIYTRADYLGDKCTEDQIGDRKGTYKVLETVTFEYTVQEVTTGEGEEQKTEKVYTVTGAYSSLLGEDNDILGLDGIIRAKNFYYNTNTKPVEITDKDADGKNIVSIPTGVDEHNLTTGSTNILPAESFYWGMGTVKTTELALRYYVYLTGSMEGTREAGSYPTNNYANLYYDNYVGNPCHKDTVSPVLPWQEANVSYAFYLVDEQGRIVVNQTTGQTGSFANKIAVTNPVVHSTIKLNSSEGVDAAEIAAAGVLPEGYTLYDAVYDANGNILTGATYTVEVKSDGDGSWEITGPKDDDTTYVMQFNPGNSADYSNKEDENGKYDYSHTVVWFAVVWKIQPLPDTVVVDYGLPVDISVLVNDMFGDHGKLAGVGSMKTEGLVWDGHTANNLLSTNPYKGKYGTATVNTATGKVRYSLETMEMNSHEQFAYAVNYTGNENAGYYYETVTVIPATTIYYEDSFVKYDSFTWDYDANAWAARASSLWSVAGDTIENAVQGEDRPGKYALTDANNIYGYDSVNLGMSTFSLGSAHKATVDYDNYASAQFTFYGTGFDIISMTDTTTGTILVEVEKETNNTWAEFDSFAVDTYYGYTMTKCHVAYAYDIVEWDEDGNPTKIDWARTAVYHATSECTDACKAKIKSKLPADPEENDVVHMVENAWVPCATENSIYQVPVIKMADKPYGHYRVTIKATYESFFDHVDPSNDNGSYDFYLDAIRIYDPANDGAGNKVIEDAYKADGEGWPSYIELRNGLIAASSFDGIANEAMDVDMTGLVFIDGAPEIGNARIADYVSYGPNNEVYLAPGQRVAFLLDTPENIANVHIGISLATADTAATYTITNIALMDSADGKVETGDYYNYKTVKIDTATDMYYDLSGWKGDIIVISNTGNIQPEGSKTTGIISVTNIKSTYKSDPNGNNSNVVVPEKPEEGIEEAEVQNLTRVYMTPKAAKVVLETLNAQDDVQTPDAPVVPDVPEISEVFEPKLFHVKLNKDEIKQGQKVLVTVTTSADVEYVMINGEKVTKFVGGGTGNRTWKLNVTGERVGNMTIEVVCCNSKGIASEAETEKVKVKAKGLLGSLDDIFG